MVLTINNQKHHSSDSISTASAPVKMMPSNERNTRNKSVARSRHNGKNNRACEGKSVSLSSAGGGALQSVLQDLEKYERGDDQETVTPTKVAETYNSLGLIRLHMQKDPRGAKECHEEALRILQGQPAEYYNSKTVAITLNDLGFCCERLEQRQEAQRLYEEAKRILRDEVSLDDSHPRLIAMERALDRVRLWISDDDALEPVRQRTVAEGA